MNDMTKRLAAWSTVLTGVICLVAASVSADTLRSPNYQIDESNLDGGGLLNESSPNFQSGGGTVGDTATGNSGSSNFQLNSGYNTTNDPALSFIINNPTANFGSFSPGNTAVTTSSFQVSNYTSYGYVVQVLGNPPANGSHMIAAMTSTGPSQAGVEQFGINLVANTSPVSVGANPDQGQFGNGTAAGNYSTTNNYRYVSGETIASASRSSGVTVYTISYIINVNGRTPGGQYAANQTLLCIGTY